VIDSPGVILLKHALLDYLVGKYQVGDLRPRMPQYSVALEATEGAEDSQSYDSHPMEHRLRAVQSRLSIKDLSPVLNSTYSSQAARFPGRILNLSRESISGHDVKQGLLTSPTEFQNSLVAFMTNNWWRR
jgi:hypothetical protein